jgi:transcription elongation factor
MPEYVTVQIGANRVIEGFYHVEGNTITMTYDDGAPVLINNEKVQRTFYDGDKPRIIAGRMTREIRRTLVDEKVEGFTSPIEMPVSGFA